METALPSNVDVILLGNRRTPGASGAWSSGLDEATRRFAPAQAIYVAVLDDDDWWDRDHIAACLAHAVARDLDMVAAGIIRHDDAHPDGRGQEPPAALSANIALMGNPHIQGSNLFVRLSALLEAGMFDESLRSTTDRDLLVRLADIGITYAPLGRATVHHDARVDRPRLSTAGSEAKSQGLAQFWRKHRLRMNEAQRTAFQTRARTLFATDVTSVAPMLPAPPFRAEERAVPALSGGNGPIVLVVGVTADGDERGAARAAPLLDDLLALQSDDRLAALDVVVVENGAGGTALRSRVDEIIGRGLRCYLVDVERQRQDAASGFFGHGFTRREGRLSISEARAITQRYVRRLMRPGAIAWILDDDKRLVPLVHEAGHLIRRPFDVVDAIARLRSSGAAVVLGVDTGAAPLPAAATLRTQLVDLAANLAAMRALGPDAVWPDRTAENVEHARAAPDYYYDLARPHTWHLELPFWFRPEGSETRVRDAFVQLCARAPRMLAGEQLFRPLFVDGDAALTLRPSIRRGGNTLVFEAGALVDMPQIVPSPAGRPTRRSDMVWALLQVHMRGRRVEEAPFAVFHDRGDADVRALDVAALVDDIRGYALYSMLRDVVNTWPGIEGPGDEMSLFARDRYQKYLVERTAAFVLSLYRSRGAARAARRMAADPDAWWNAGPEMREHVEGLAAFAERAHASVESGVLDQVRAAVADTPPLEIDVYVRALREKLDQAAMPVAVKPEWLRQERVRIAQAQVERLARPAGALRLLGAGHEGVVFTDEREVFKVLDLWRANAPERDRELLRSLTGKWTDTEGLYPLERLIESGPHTILVYPYEPTEPYSGGHASGLVLLLRECREHGIAFRNMHPRNLRVRGDRVRLVDYGADLALLDANEWRHMARRAWLCWRWPHHPDLEGLMRRALREDVPELTGWERLERAALAPDAMHELNRLVLDAVVRAAPSSVLDFGCGAGRVVSDLARRGIRAVGYDPKPSPRWADQEGTTFTTDRPTALGGVPYDVAVCSLVLCTIEDDAAYRAVLSDLRAAVRDGGRVVIAVCNPLHTLGGDTPLQRRIVPAGADPDRTLAWTKQVHGTGALRRDVHRPLHVLRRDLLRAGLLVESVDETEAVDLARLEPASDFMVLTARAVVSRSRVSLLVRTSALAWRTVETQLRHLVEQLEGPRAFHERVAVLDARRNGFVRPYDQADLDAVRSTLEALVAEGTIDRVVEVPKAADEIAALHQRWFGLPATDTHAVSGMPVAASLVGFEACTGDHILHVDDDLLVARLDRSHDYLGELVDVLERDPAAICASLNICHERDQPWTTGGSDGPWRVEVRGTLLHRRRLLDVRPLPNESSGPSLVRTWHRSLDARIRERTLHSVRGGRSATFFIHPPNDRKRDRHTWLAVLDRVEAGHVPSVQRGSVDLAGGLDEWLGPRRDEKIIVIACGRNVSAGRVARFRDALVAQTERDWGLVVVEDGGSRTSADTVRSQLGRLPNTTVLTLRERRGALANIVWAMRYVCSNPRSIIVLVDLDDALLGSGALARVATEFDQGADLTVGGMLRTDKAKQYPVDFVRPRQTRGGNVWQHLRAFRRELFEDVPDQALRLDGEYVDLAWDWALMLALVEVATAPRYIDETLYLHEPSGVGKSGEDRIMREHVIARIVSKPGPLHGGGR
jgi:glycosyltransferase involved in cell wall biosynthesis/SAM-dependent methyltransferase